jgi:hypothetical protein
MKSNEQVLKEIQRCKDQIEFMKKENPKLYEEDISELSTKIIILGWVLSDKG